MVPAVPYSFRGHQTVTAAVVTLSTATVAASETDVTDQVLHFSCKKCFESFIPILTAVFKNMYLIYVYTYIYINMFFFA